jgi:hypothetical protein
MKPAAKEIAIRPACEWPREGDWSSEGSVWLQG